MPTKAFKATGEAHRRAFPHLRFQILVPLSFVVVDHAQHQHQEIPVGGLGDAMRGVSLTAEVDIPARRKARFTINAVQELRAASSWIAITDLLTARLME